jgi:hypothetical protein
MKTMHVLDACQCHRTISRRQCQSTSMHGRNHERKSAKAMMLEWFYEGLTRVPSSASHKRFACMAAAMNAIRTLKSRRDNNA